MIYNFEENEIRKKQLLKRDIKDTAGKCALVLLTLSILTFVGGSIIIYILKIRSAVLGINNSDNGMILGISKEGYNFFVGYLPCIFADIIAIIICTIFFKTKIKEYIALKKDVSSAFLISGSFASIGVGMISSIIFLIYSMVFNSQGIEIPSPDFSIPKNGVYLVLFFSYTCIIAPLFEEIIFRGYILNNMRRYGNITAVIISSIFFCMFHFNLVQLVNPILMGVMLSFIAIKSESILPCIIVHMFNNTCAMLTTVISYSGSQWISLLWGSFYYLAGISAVIFFMFNYGKEFIQSMSEKYKYMKLRKNIFYSFCNKWSILYILFYIFMVSTSIIVKNI
ncbi:MAG: lysostaphin resistance A-like protein [Clostridium sp.]